MESTVRHRTNRMQMCGAVATVCMGSGDLSKVVVALNLLRRLLGCCGRNPEAVAVLPDLMHGLLKCAAEPSAEVCHQYCFLK